MTDSTIKDDTEVTEAGQGDAGEQQADAEPDRTEAKLRRRAQQAETKLAVAEAIVSEVNREVAENIASQRLANAGDLWHSVELSDLLDTSGKLDTAKLAATLDSVLKAKPYLAKRSAPPASIVTGDGKPPTAGTPSFEQAFMPKVD